MNITFTAFLPAIATGVAAGLIFWGGLWWTVRQLANHPHPALIMLVSFVIRSVIVIGAFYWMMNAHWEQLAVALLAFMSIRMVLAKTLTKQLWSPSTLRQNDGNRS